MIYLLFGSNPAINDLQKQLAWQKEQRYRSRRGSEEPVTGKVTGLGERTSSIPMLALYKLLSIYTRPIMKTFH
ncbi:hypothetical protein NQ317_010240 [Molorchus minor]|uniref:Uncharacterized protein n=1 Tax=Molorchus minor TaxID=1323400 RepID=A0ABQ9JJ31_9CUCU|nr:hypothetical protein NQ317_010240 [Molorchus minor]